MCAVLTPEQFQYGSAGVPMPSMEVKLVDVKEAGYLTSGTPQRGEVWLRGASVTHGYFKRDDLNNDESIFTKDGWFRTGDVGEWNPDGTLKLIDRYALRLLACIHILHRIPHDAYDDSGSRTSSNCRVESTLPWNALKPFTNRATSSEISAFMLSLTRISLWLSFSRMRPILDTT